MADIVIIDDDPNVLCVLTGILEAEGHHVRLAANGIDGLTIIRRQPPHVVVTDIVMPQKEGLEFIGELRRKFPKMGILAISGVAQRSFYLNLARQLGADAVLAKPFRSLEFARAVADLLSSVAVRGWQPFSPA